ncbi:MAG: UDP-N-acetylmuramoyl-L-alanine--D-glutamate ligase [Bacteriovoracales bacterium]|nr:UDP-N-acetylmuramoyl-L-alanine--D-glutamate ligase [Bacteriovoracales bacterium]
MDRYRNKNVLIVGIGKTGFALINFFNSLDCHITVTDIKPIFDLNKAVKKLKKITPAIQMTFGEHRDEDFLKADVIVYSSSVNPNLPQLQLAKNHGRAVFSEFALANQLCDKPIISVCGRFGRSSVAHMISYALKLNGSNTFVGGTPDNPFINLFLQDKYDEIDYVIVETNSLQLKGLEGFHPILVVYTEIGPEYPEDHFGFYGDYLNTKLSATKNLNSDNFLIVNFDRLANHTFFRNQKAQTYWYSRKSFSKMGVIHEIQGTHFHERRIHSNIHFHSEFRVTNMRIVGQQNRESLLAAITACKALGVSNKSIQELIIKFPGTPHNLEYITEKNGVRFYNDSQSENMSQVAESVKAFKDSVILIAGGKDTEQDYELYAEQLGSHVRVIVLVGECKERMNRVLGNIAQTYLVGSFEESILIAYQKSRTGDTILLSPGNPATDIFRDFKERGNYYKKLIYQF